MLEALYFADHVVTTTRCTRSVSSRRCRWGAWRTAPALEARGSSLPVNHLSRHPL
jgi:hypothetical protein